MRSTQRLLRGRAARAAVVSTLAAVTLTGCDFSVYDLPLPGGADLGEDPYSVTVQFRDVLDLVPKSSVKVDEVTVGRVAKVELDGYTAVVTLDLRKDVKLPDNAIAEIRQTSLLGEKFVSLSPPETGASTDLLGEGDDIPLEHTGRNPEVEEVLGALALVLNGGGVAQLKTIASELNTTFSGREGNVRSLLTQLSTFMAQIDSSKEDILTALDQVNQLAVSLNQQKGSLTTALDELPNALASIDRQRADLVKVLQALDELSAVGTRVIQQSKAATIDSLNALAPTLSQLAKAGDNLPKSLQIILTYPFVDGVVGKNPAQARDLHMGDYTNLSVQLELDLDKLPVVPGLPGVPSLPDLVKICKESPLKPVCDLLESPPAVPLPSLPIPTLTLPPVLPGLPGLGAGADTGAGCLLGLLCRTTPDLGEPAGGRPSGLAIAPTADPRTVDTDLGALLVWGMVKR